VYDVSTFSEDSPTKIKIIYSLFTASCVLCILGLRGLHSVIRWMMLYWSC